MKKTWVTGILAIMAALVMAQDAGKVYLVRTGQPLRKTISQTVRKTGTLTSPAEVSVGAKVSGRLIRLELENGMSLTEGMVVKKGERIAEIDSRDYMAQVAAATATVASSLATMKDTNREYKRAKKLFEEGTATEQERDQAEADYERAQAAYHQALAQEKSAIINRDECVILAPMDGVISKCPIKPGTLVNSGTEIVVVTQLNPIRFHAYLPTTLFAKLEPEKTEILIEVDAYPGQPVLAKLTRIYPVADKETRTIKIEARMDNSAGRYVPGMYAVGNIALEHRDNVLCVPYDCVIRNDKERIVYCVEGGVAKAVKVTLGIRQDEIVEVLDGLTDKDVIVVAGQHRLTDGALVKEEVEK